MKGFKNSLISFTKDGVLWIFILGLILTTTACSDDINVGSNYPSLQLVNEIGDEDRAIVYVGLVGYEFQLLNILPGSSQTFKLENGMPGGYENINVRVQLSGPQRIIRDLAVSFADGETRTIIAKGCFGPEGCEGYTFELE